MPCRHRADRILRAAAALSLFALVLAFQAHAQTPAPQPPTLSSPELYSQSFKVLFVLFILAILLESGLATIFNWRPFVDFFDSRGVKTVVSVGFAWFFVSAFDLDVTTRLVNVYSGSAFPVSVPGQLVTALVLAGGSSGVNNLLLALGFRDQKPHEAAAPRPPPTQAWLAVALVRNRAKGPVVVLIGPDHDALAVAGVIAGSSPRSWLVRYFLRDRGRFPPSGGWVLGANQPCAVALEGSDREGNALQARWGPRPIAPGAIVDLELRL